MPSLQSHRTMWVHPKPPRIHRSWIQPRPEGCWTLSAGAIYRYLLENFLILFFESPSGSRGRTLTILNLYFLSAVVEVLYEVASAGASRRIRLPHPFAPNVSSA